MFVLPCLHFSFCILHRAFTIHSPSCHIPRSPRPLEVEAAEPTVDVQHFAGQVQPGTHARLHRRGIDLIERYAAGRGLGVVEPAAACDGQRPRGQRVREAAAVLSRQMRQRARRVEMRAW